MVANRGQSRGSSTADAGGKNRARALPRRPHRAREPGSAGGSTARARSSDRAPCACGRPRRLHYDPRRYGIRVSTFVALVLGALFTPSTLAQVTAYTDRATLGSDETFELVVEVAGDRVDDEPDLTPLQSNFEVVRKSRSTRVNIVGGKTTAQTRFHFTLAPRGPGTFEIPPLEVGDQVTEPIALTVTPPRPSVGTVSSQHIFIEAEVAPRDPYVQSQVTYTVRLFHAVDIREGSLSEPELPRAVVERLGDDVSYNVERGGRRYRVIERRYAIFPQASGPMIISAPVFSGQVPDDAASQSSNSLFGRRGGFGGDPFGGFFHPTRPARARGESVELEVRAIPVEAVGSPWLPAESVDLKESWTSEPLTFRVGEPATRTLTVLARGVTGAQLPALEVEHDPSMKVYPDRPVAKTATEGVHVLGRQEVKLAVVPTRSGSFTLPEIVLHWWDTKANQPRIARIPAREVVVLPPAAPSSALPPSTAADADLASSSTPDLSTSERNPWPLVSFALLAAWLITISMWWWQRRRAPPRAAAPSARKRSADHLPGALRRACRTQSPGAARDAVLAWAASTWPDAPTTLVGVAQRVRSTEARTALHGLDRALYAATEHGWNGEAFLSAMSEVIREKPAPPTAPPGPLPALYPRG